MKVCPVCNRTYPDDAQVFCLEDGTQLMPASFGGGGSESFDPNATLAYTPARETNPPPENLYRPTPFAPPPATPGWSPTPYTPSPYAPSKSGSKAWIIAAIAAVIVLGIGIIVLIAIIGRDSTANANSSSNRTVVNSTNTSNSTNRAPANTNNTERNTNSTGSTVLKDDFSAENWPTGENGYGSFYQDGEYHMKGKPGIYVFMFPLNRSSNEIVRYASKDATVKVTMRNVDGKSPEYGYGLIAHGKVNSKGSLDGYAFLLYTGSTPKYQIARFADGQATSLVPWTESTAIRGGTNSNQIEIRTTGSELSMYVNGRFFRTITDTANYTDGYVGLYTSEPNEVAFDDMEIERNTSGLTP